MAGGQVAEANEDTADNMSRPVRITDAQLRVLLHLARGSTYAVIARTLYLSPTTVRSHVEALQRRLCASNNVSLVLAAAVVGLLSVDGWPIELTGITEFDPDLLAP